MSVPERTRNAYSSVTSDLQALDNYVSTTMRRWSDLRGYPFKRRIKTVESLSEKLETGRYSKWSDLDDLYACTIVIPTVSHEADVLEFLGKVFNQVALRGRNTTQKAPEVFRFDSTRFVGKVHAGPDLPYPAGMSDILFEVQVSTAFEYAWAVVTHELVYKSSDFDWRKARLAAQLKASVEQIELVIAGFEANLDFVPRSKHQESDAKQSIVVTFKELIADEIIPQTLEPASWTRFANNLFDLVKSFAKKPSQTPYKVDEFIKAVDVQLRRKDLQPTPTSGSLFQLVASEAHAGRIGGASLENFTIVESPELRDFYGIRDVPKPFNFEA
ncbi:hypothetical protein ACWGR4_27165 [Embleya sp. NPDC055664]